MKKLLMFFGALTFVTQAHCAGNHDHEFLTFDNISNHSIRLDYHDGKNNQSSILKSGERAVLKFSISTLDQGPEKDLAIVKDQHLRRITISLDKGNNPDDIQENILSFKRKPAGPVRLTDELLRNYLKLNN